jgi:signal transduction histidine kinase
MSEVGQTVMPEPESLVLNLLREIRGRLDQTDSKIDAVHDKLDAKFDAVRDDLSGQIVGLRRAVVEYHSAVVGHGVLISDIDARLRRVELHLNLPEAH